MTRAPTPWQGRPPGPQPTPWRVRVLAFESVHAVIREISRLLIKAERSRDVERATAINQLWEINSKLKAELLEVERDIQAGQNRRVEAVVFRAALATLR